MKDSVQKLNDQLEAMNLPTVTVTSLCPQREAYLDHMANPDWGDKDWVRQMKKLTDEYALAFHHYVAERHPHLLFERGEDKVYFLYNASTGVYDEQPLSIIRGIVMSLLTTEDLQFYCTERFVKDCLNRYRALYPHRAVMYDDFDNNIDLFHARNGWVNLATLEFQPHTPSILSRRVSAVSYDAAATCPRYDQFLDADIQVAADAVRVMDQFSGLCLTSDIRYQKMLTLIGRPGSGKSTLLDIWTYILGDMATQKRLTELSSESSRFAGGNLIGKTLCWFDEVDVKRSEMNNNLGTLITGSTIRVERKGINSIVMGKNMLKCVLTANSLPMSSEHGMYRRIIYIPFNRSFYDEGLQQVDILEQLYAEVSGILNRMIRGLHDLRKYNGFTVISGHDDMVEDYKASSDTIAEFLDTYFIPDQTSKITTKELFTSYKIFVKDDKYALSLTPQRFGRLLASQPLTRFSQIKAVKGASGMRTWQGLRLRDEYMFENDVIKEKFVYQRENDF